MSTESLPNCAACGKGGEGVKLKDCSGCHTAKYCNRACQSAHWREHKAECKRAAAAFEEALFNDPPPQEDCPICCLPMPLQYEQRMYHSCCGTVLCGGCSSTADMHSFTAGADAGVEDPCPFCRSGPPASDEQEISWFKRRMEAGDAETLRVFASRIMGGDMGLRVEPKKAVELWQQAAEMGDLEAHFRLGGVFLFGEGTSGLCNIADAKSNDLEKAKRHFQLAAIGGHVMARHALGGVASEIDGDVKTAVRHWMIAAKAGENDSLENIKRAYFKRQGVTKEEFAAALRAHQKATDEMKSEQRERYCASKIGARIPS